MTQVLAAAGLWAGGATAPGWIAIDDGRVVDRGDGDAPRGATDLGDAVLAPGYIDLQVNGVEDIDFADADTAGWTRAGSVLAAHGTTAYCATLISAPRESYAPALERIDAARVAADAGGDPTILGAHLEGPFLGGAPGAHDPAHLSDADAAWLDALVGSHPGLVRIVTLAPEVDPQHAAIRGLAAAGVVVALGHTTASHEEATRAADAGATVVTHLFNGMAPFHHREPGVVGAALTDPRLTATLIADLVHVHPAALRAVIAASPRIALVSDAVACGGELVPREGAAWTADGVLAGATTLLDRAVANVAGLGVPVARAVQMATAIPASILGLTDRGHLDVGACADAVALDPATLAVRRVWVRGEARA